jgi:hypothetical protein
MDEIILGKRYYVSTVGNVITVMNVRNFNVEKYKNSKDIFMIEFL